MDRIEYRAVCRALDSDRHDHATRYQRARANNLVVRAGPRTRRVGKPISEGLPVGVVPASSRPREHEGCAVLGMANRVVKGHEAAHRVCKHGNRSVPQMPPQLVEVVGHTFEAVGTRRSNARTAASAIVVKDQREAVLERCQASCEVVSDVRRASLAGVQHRARPANEVVDPDPIGGVKGPHPIGR